MTLRQALAYPFQNGNLLKILPIAIIASLLLYVMNFVDNFVLVSGAALALFVMSLALVGYSISIVEQVMRGDQQITSIRLKTDVGRGCMSYIAVLLYNVPLFIGIFVWVLLALPMINLASDATLTSGLLSMIVLTSGFAFLIFIGLFASLVMMVAYARYASDGTTQALFDLGENINLVRHNAGLSLGMLGRLFILSLLNALIVGAISLVSYFLFPNMLAYDSYFYEPPMVEGLAYALMEVLSYTVSIVFVVSGSHLIAQYGLALGLDGRKRKDSDADAGSNTAAIIVLFLVGLVFVVGMAIFMIVMLLAPSMEAVFMDVMTGL